RGACSVGGWLVPLLVTSSCASRCFANSCARRTIAALSLCLHRLWGALAKSIQSQRPFTTWYAVLPLDCEATRAVPSGSNSTSPARAILTAASTLPAHAGSLALAL